MVTLPLILRKRRQPSLFKLKKEKVRFNLGPILVALLLAPYPLKVVQAEKNKQSNRMKQKFKNKK